MEPLWVATEPALDDLVGRLLDEPRYALDTEFHGERSYWPRLALIQIAWPGGLALVDPLTIDASRLAPLLAAPSCMVAHAAEQDLAILERLCGHGPTQMFDTQVAAGFLGLGSPSLVALVEKLLGVRLGKGDRLTDWTRRPLTAEQTRRTPPPMSRTCSSCRTCSSRGSKPSADSSGRSTSAKTAARRCAPAPNPKSRGGASKARGNCGAGRAVSRRRSRPGANAPPKASTCRLATCCRSSRSRGSCSVRRGRARSSPASAASTTGPRRTAPPTPSSAR